jgi:hypothetical protein
MLKPVTLYIKKHNKTGMLYFGRTTRKNTRTYKGPGVYWIDHLKVHGRDVTHLWDCQFTDEDDMKEFALFFSEFFNIVDEKNNNGKKTWANLVPEDGTAGVGPLGHKRTKEYWENWKQIRKGHDVSLESRLLMRDKKLGIKASEETRKKMSRRSEGENNANALQWTVTSPEGKTFIVVALRKWARDNGYNYMHIYHNKYGWTAVKHSNDKGGPGKKRQEA